MDVDSEVIAIKEKKKIYVTNKEYLKWSQMLKKWLQNVNYKWLLLYTS